MKKIKKIATECSLSSTCHGIPNIARAKDNYCLILMWSLSFAICSGYCLCLTVISLKEFLNYPVITSIDIINESPALFPTVTLCNLNGYSIQNLVNETLINCRFNNQQCSLKDFTQVHFSSYGFCLRFNFNPNDLKKTYVLSAIRMFRAM